MKFTCTLTAFLILIFSISFAAVYEAGGGANYTISYSDDWYRVPYGAVTQFLEMQEVTDSTFNYSVVLASRENQRFYLGPYLFILFEPTGRLDKDQMDLALQAVSAEYGQPYVTDLIDNKAGKFEDNQPVYDSTINAVVTKSTVRFAGSYKTLLEIKKFYEKGIAIFLCYTPTDLYAANEKIYLDILRSFKYISDGSYDAASKPKIVDVAARTQDEDSFWGSLLSYILGIVLIILAVIIWKIKN